jgi:hypothetical protein
MIEMIAVFNSTEELARRSRGSGIGGGQIIAPATAADAL